MPRAKQRTSALREHVLESALGMLESDGIAAFTARRIAERAGTSVPAVYELFGDKAGLVRALFFEGFRLLRERFDQAADEDDDALAALLALFRGFRAFARDNPVLTAVMFSRPFADFDPRPADLKAGSGVRESIVSRVRRCVEAEILSGDPTDIAHVLLAIAQGLAAQENAGWLGTSKASIERRWRLALDAAIAGFAAPRAAARGQRENA